MLQATLSEEKSTSNGCQKYTIGKRPQAISKNSILLCIPYESVWDVTDCTKTCQASEGREKALR